MDSQLRGARRTVELHALSESAALAAGYADHLSRALAQIDQTAEHLAQGWERGRAGQALNPRLSGEASRELLRARRRGPPAGQAYAAITVFDAQGRVLAWAADGGSAGLGQDDIGAALRAHAGTGAGPARIVFSGARVPLLLVSRGLRDRDGRPDGMIVIALEPGALPPFGGGSVAGQSAQLTLFDAHGRQWRMSANTQAVWHALPPSNAPAVRPAAVGRADSATANESGSGPAPMLAAPVAISGVADGAGRRGALHQEGPHGAAFLAWQPLAVYPFGALVALDQVGMLRPYEAIRAAYWGGAGGATALLLLLMTAVALVARRSTAGQRQSDRSEGMSNAYRMATADTNDGFFIVAAVRGKDNEIADFEFIDCDAPGADLFGMRREQLVGLRLQSRAHEPYFRDLIQSYQQAMLSGFTEQEIELPDNNPFHLRWIRRRVVRTGEHLAVTLQDISDSKSRQEELRRLANEDALTGLPNRLWLNHFLPRAIGEARAAGQMLSLLFIDLDGFKEINDSKGHAEGDVVLKAAAHRLRAVLRPTDHVVRLGGDEFVVILHPIDSEDNVTRVAQRIEETFGEPFMLCDGRQFMSASVGISLYPRDGADTETLLKNADMAMYAVKTAGKGHHRFYRPELYEVIRAKRDVEQSLVVALADNQFVIHYQAQVDAADGQLCGMEALVRWIHPSRGLLAPREFIPVAEGCGLIVQLGEMVVELVCRQLVRWRAAGLRLVPVAINVSARQFARGDLHHTLAAAAARHQLDISLIQLDIAEAAMMGGHDAALAQLAALRALGVKLVLDDFGTGYCSLSQLQSLRMDGLKIDRAFTAELARCERGAVFIGAIVSMAHALGMSVVAEGVETAEQLALLRRLGCNEVQGYLIARPAGAEAMAALLERRTLFDHLPAPGPGLN
ncbi:MAG: EAL domain-containing protein [Pseudomonadota bacterium]